MSKLFNITKSLDIQYGNAICYSGYREGQDPRKGIYPTYEEIKQDLMILNNNWSYLRLYDCSQHAVTVLKVIAQENLPFKVMLGADLAAEISNPDCPWDANFDDDLLVRNKLANSQQIDDLIDLASHYPEIVFAVSIGNEASVDWTDHLVSVASLVEYATRVKAGVRQPVTFCENYVPWTQKLAPLVEILDFISIHTYPVWEYQSIDNALAYTDQNYRSVAEHYPDKTVVITEAGWTTMSNGRGIEPWNANQHLQAEYCNQLINWAEENQILTFVFEAFDEPWKGSEDAAEPEKHWGFYTVDRKPKQIAQTLFYPDKAYLSA